MRLRLAKFLASLALLPGWDHVRLAVIGDYGRRGLPIIQVSQMVQSWKPDAVITVGDNLQLKGEYWEFDEVVYPAYKWIIDRELLFTALGNHDWGYPWDAGWKVDEIPLLQRLTYLPGNKRYYDVVFGGNLVHVFVIDSDAREPDGRSVDSVQAQWLKNALAASTATYKLVFMHELPYSSCMWGDRRVLQWPFKEWGADAVFSGHCHDYERIMVDGFPYFVNGLGGADDKTPFQTLTAGSVVRFIDGYGAQLIEANRKELVVTFITTDGTVIDRYVIPARR